MNDGTLDDDDDAPRLSRRHWRDRHALKAALAAGAALLLSGGLLYAWHWWRTARIAARASTRPAQARHLLLFGKRLHDGRPDGDLRQRVARVHALLQDDADRRAWLLGGRTAPGPTEAGAAREALRALGLVDDTRVHLEEASAHTLDNLRHARDLIAADGGGAVVLVTSRYHLGRCALLARNLGLAHELCAAEDRLVWDARTLRALSAEAALSLWADVGTRYARLVRHRDMMARVS